MCRSALRFHTPSRCVTHPNDGYKYRQSWREFHNNSTHIFFSHLIEYELLGGHFQPTRVKKKDEFLYGWAEGWISAVRVLQKVWLALTLVNTWSEWAEIWWEVRFWKAVLFGTEIEVKGLTKLLLRWLFWTTLTFLELTWVDSVADWRTVVTHSGLADQGDFAGWSILLTAVTHHQNFLFLVCLL